MAETYLGTITESEASALWDLFMRKTALEDLMLCINEGEKPSLYEKVVNDLTETLKDLHGWWKNTSKKYEWPVSEKMHWRAEFETRKIFICENLDSNASKE